MQPGQWVTQEFDFRAPKTDWKQTIPMPRKTAQANYEHFSWPSDAVNTNAPEPDRGGQADMARHLTRVRMEQAGSAGQRVQASGNLRALLGQVITWIEHHEPSSPVSIVLRQAQNLWGKRYAEIIAAVPPELLAQWDAQLNQEEGGV